MLDCRFLLKSPHIRPREALLRGEFLWEGVLAKELWRRKIIWVAHSSIVPTSLEPPELCGYEGLFPKRDSGSREMEKSENMNWTAPAPTPSHPTRAHVPTCPPLEQGCQGHAFADDRVASCLFTIRHLKSSQSVWKSPGWKVLQSRCQICNHVTHACSTVC